MLNTILLSSIFVISPVHMERPILTLAQCYVESRFRSTAIGKKQEKGAFQVLEKHWGKVPKDSKEQVEQYEEIMKELMSNNNQDVSKSVRAYNGKGKGAKKYLAKVRQKALEIALI